MDIGCGILLADKDSFHSIPFFKGHLLKLLKEPSVL